MASDLQNIIKKIDLTKKEAESFRPLSQEQENRLIKKFKLDWNFHSCYIEGNNLTYSETRSFLHWHLTADNKPLRDHLEMKGHNEAVEYLMDILKGVEIELTEHLIRHLHKVILPEEFETDAITPDGKKTKRIIKTGQYKSLANHVKTKSGEMFYFVSPEDTPAQMNDLLKWLNEELHNKQNHPIIIASLFHYKFVRIHPFDDGNGRMARLLMNLILMKFEFPPIIIPFQIKEDYYNSLQYADSQDIDKFIIFIGERLIESLQLVIKAGKNEPLEEADDIDKMVKMIEKKLSGVDDENTLQKELNIETFKDKFVKSIIPLNEKLFNKMELFSKFFRGYELIFEFDKVKQVSNSLPSQYFDEFVEISNEIIRKNLIIKDFEMCFKYSGFLKSGTKTFNTGVWLSFSFNQYTYSIYSPSIQGLEIRKMYHQILTDDEINQIIIKLATYIAERIEENTKE